MKKAFGGRWVHLASAPFAKFQPVKIRPPLGLSQRSHDWRLRGRDFFSPLRREVCRQRAANLAAEGGRGRGRNRPS